MLKYINYHLEEIHTQIISQPLEHIIREKNEIKEMKKSKNEEWNEVCNEYILHTWEMTTFRFFSTHWPPRHLKQKTKACATPTLTSPLTEELPPVNNNCNYVQGASNFCLNKLK